jgi:hypothetical protein
VVELAEGLRAGAGLGEHQVVPAALDPDQGDVPAQAV